MKYRTKISCTSKEKHRNVAFKNLFGLIVDSNNQETLFVAREWKFQSIRKSFKVVVEKFQLPNDLKKFSLLLGVEEKEKNMIEQDFESAARTILDWERKKCLKIVRKKYSKDPRNIFFRQRMNCSNFLDYRSETSSLATTAWGSGLCRLCRKKSSASQGTYTIYYSTE